MKKRVVGRPPKPKGEKFQLATYSLTPPAYKWVQSEHERTGCSKSKIVSQLIETQLAQFHT